jgi:RhtB (resistance to homoserine/threonine) family protein
MTNFITTFFIIASMHFLGVVSPGPDFVLVTRNALLYPRRIAIYTALGITLGIMVHMTYCLLGLAVIISQSLLFFTVLKYLGSAYLIYLGIKALLPEKTLNSNSPRSNDSATPALSAHQALWQGFLCNTLNPKAALFFLGLFTLAIKPTTPWWQQVFYAAWMVTMTFLWFSLLSVLITNPHIRAKLIRIQPWITKIMGILLIVFGVELVLWLHH